MNSLLRFCNIVDGTNRRVASVIGYLAILIMAFGVYEVSARYFFNRPTNWVWEYNSLLMCAIAALGGGYCLLVRGHVRVDIVYSRFSPRTKAIIDLCTSFFVFIFFASLLWHGIPGTWASILRLETRQAACQPPIYIFKAILVIGIFLFLLQVVANFIRWLGIAVGKVES